MKAVISRKIHFTPGDINLKCRRINFNLPDDCEPIWISHDVVESHLHNVLSITFDMAEVLIMKAVCRAQSLLHDPQLLANTTIFLRQEGNHRRLHNKFNETLQQQGYARIPAMIAKLYEEFAVWMDIENNLGAALRMAALFENLAAHLARRFLRCLEDRYSIMQSIMALLFGYHAAEELEHKAICFDCYTDIYGHTPVQSTMHIVEWNQFNEKIHHLLMSGITYFMMIDRLQAADQTPISRCWLEEKVFGVQGIISPTSEYYLYRESDFHPWQIDDQKLIQRWDTHWNNYYSICKKTS